MKHRGMSGGTLLSMLVIIACATYIGRHWSLPFSWVVTISVIALYCGFQAFSGLEKDNTERLQEIASLKDEVQRLTDELSEAEDQLLELEFSDTKSTEVDEIY